MADVASPAHPAEETIVGDENIAKRKREDTAEGAEGADVEVSCVKKAKEDDQAGEQVEGEEGQNLGEKDAQLAAQSDKTGSDAQVVLGPKKFLNAVELFSYFYKFLQLWPTNVNTNKYETMVLTELLLKGHSDPTSKVGAGVVAFQVQVHPTWHSRCYYVVRVDGSCEDFSYRKCCDRILPLPAEYVADGRVRIEMLNLGNFHKFKDLRAAEDGSGESNKGRGGGRGEVGTGVVVEAEVEVEGDGEVVAEEAEVVAIVDGVGVAEGGGEAVLAREERCSPTGTVPIV